MEYRDVLTKHGYMTMAWYFQEKYCDKCPTTRQCGKLNALETCELFNQWFTEVHYIKQHINHFDIKNVQPISDSSFYQGPPQWTEIPKEKEKSWNKWKW